MKGKLLTLFITILAITGCESDPAPTSQVQRPLTQVVVKTVTPEAIEIINELNGRISSSLISEVRPQITGIIKDRLFEEGQEVEEGQVLYKVDPTQYLAAKQQALASLKSVEADVSAALLKYKRYQALIKEKAVSKQDLDEARATYNKLLATLEERKATLNLAEINLNYTEIKSPISGSIGISNVTPGALVTANQLESLTLVTKLDPVNIDITQQSNEFLQQADLKDQFNTKEVPVKIFLENNKEYPIQGKLKTSEFIVDPHTNSITLRATVNNPNRQLLPGMYVKVELNNGVNPNAITVAHQSVFYDSLGKPYVYVVNEENKVIERNVEIAGSFNNKWIIASGLEAGERVVFQGRDKIKPGDTVQVEEFQEEVKELVGEK